MVNSHALILVPSSKLSCFAHAFMMVSCTRSSALSWRPDSENANALRLGSVASRSRLNEGGSAGLVLAGFDGGATALFLAGIGFPLLFHLVELFEELQELVGDGFILHSPVKGSQLHADIGVWTQAFVPTAATRGGCILHFGFFFHHRAFANSKAGVPYPARIMQATQNSSGGARNFPLDSPLLLAGAALPFAADRRIASQGVSFDDLDHADSSASALFASVFPRCDRFTDFRRCLCRGDP